MAKINWPKAKTEYVTDITQSYRSIAKRYGVNFSSVRDKAVKEKWVALRNKIQTEATHLTTQKMGSSIAEVNARHVKTALLLQENGISSITKRKLKPRNYDQALRSIDKGIDIERKAIGADKPEALTVGTQHNTIINYNQFVERYSHK